MNTNTSSINYEYLLGASDRRIPIYRHNERFFPFVSLTHITDGEFFCEYEGELLSAVPGDTLYVPECVLHNVYTLSPARGSWGHVGATSYKYELPRVRRRPIIIKGEDSLALKKKLDTLAKIKFDTVRAIYERDNCISGIFCELSKYSEECAISKKPDFCIMLQEYISENITEKFSLDELAKMAYISKSSLCHKFKAAMGISLIDYILREKIKTSFYMLSGGMNNRHIAEKLNLSDEYYYSKLFKKVVGISPKEYKKTYFEA